MGNPIERFPGTAKVATIITPTGPLSVLRVVAVRLLAEGVISGDLDGVLHANDAATIKAAMMSQGVCDFCSSPGIEHVFDMPDFDMGGGGVTSTDGWAACGTCTALVNANRRKDLLTRASNSLAFSKFSKDALKGLHNRFWYSFDGMDIATRLGGTLSDFVNDKLPDPPPELKFTNRESRINALSGITGLSVSDLERVIAGGGSELLTPQLAVKVMTWAKKYDQNPGSVDAKLLLTLVGEPRKPLADVLPHWQRALDAKVDVMRTLGSLLNRTQKEEYFTESIDVNDPAAVRKIAQTAEARQTFRNLGFDQDYRLIQAATVYSFNAETEAAIIEASSSIPHNAPLSSIETPTGSGWFWFGSPLTVASSPAASDHTHALLWAWVNATGGPNEATDPVRSLMFSAYVRDEKGQMGSLSGKLLPSTRWYWPLEMSFHDMLQFNARSWLKSYGPGTVMDGDPGIISQQDTVNIISELSLFFAQACLWFRQTVPGTQKKLDPILTQTPGHIERHARKRAQKELKADAPPVVHVVALRKTAKVEADPAEPGHEPGSRDYQCRWIVKGHSRLQACGPGRKDRKLIWIEAHPAGPENKPLRTKTTVYAVVR